MTLKRPNGKQPGCEGTVQHKPGPDHLVPRMPAQEIEDAKLEDRERQPAQDLVEEASMQSFPCSDPPCYTRSHA